MAFLATRNPKISSFQKHKKRLKTRARKLGFPRFSYVPTYRRIELAIFNFYNPRVLYERLMFR